MGRRVRGQQYCRRALELALVRPHVSLTIGPQIAAEPLPNLVVLTGMNGAGKTQLLEAIANGSVSVDGAELQNPLARIVPFGQIQAQNLNALAPQNVRDRWVIVRDHVRNAFNTAIQQAQRER